MEFSIGLITQLNAPSAGHIRNCAFAQLQTDIVVPELQLLTITQISILVFFLRILFTLYREMLKDISVAVGQQTQWPLTHWSFSGWHARLLLVFCTFTNTITFTGEDPLTFGLFPAYWFSRLFFTPPLTGRPALVSPGNNILVLPEYMSQTPASVILLLGENPLLNTHHQLFVSHPWRKCEMILQTSFVMKVCQWQGL